MITLNPVALRKAKTPLSFGCSECTRVEVPKTLANSADPFMMAHTEPPYQYLRSFPLNFNSLNI